MSLTPSAASVTGGGIISVSVTDNPSMPGDFVALAIVGSTATHVPGYWLYLNGTQTAPTTAPTSTMLTFNVPPAAGQYEFRLYANDTFTLLTKSTPFTVPGLSSSSSGGLFPLEVSSNKKYFGGPERTAFHRGRGHGVVAGQPTRPIGRHTLLGRPQEPRLYGRDRRTGGAYVYHPLTRLGQRLRPGPVLQPLRLHHRQRRLLHGG